MKYLVLLSLLLTGCVDNREGKTDVEDSTEDGRAMRYGACYCNTRVRAGVSYIEKTKYKYSSNLYMIRCNDGVRQHYQVPPYTEIIYGKKPNSCEGI